MSDMKLTDLPQEAVDAFNKHNHNEDGKRIPNGGIEDLAITTAKLAPNAVTADKMANNAVTGDKVLNWSLGVEKFKPGVLATVDMTSANVSFKNYIANGLGLDWDSGLNLIVRKGRANINDVFVDSVSDMNLPIPANSHGLAYLGKDGALGFAPFKYPTIDSNFIFAYNFNDANPATKVTDLTGNGYDLVGDGTLTDIMSELGHIGMGCSTGANSGLKSTKTVNIPSANKYTMIWAGIMRDNGVDEIPLCVGNNGNARYFQITPPSGDNYFWYTRDPVLGVMQPRVHAIMNKLNVVIVDFDGYYQRFFFNGRMVAKRKLMSTSAASITGNIFVGENYDVSHRSPKRNIHCFAGYTTKVYTQREIADMCAAMGVANQYDVPMATVPTFIGEDTENHIWNMDETTGNTIADTGTKFTTALQGIAVNTGIEKSEIGLGMKRRFGGATSKISLGNYTFPANFSFFAVIEIKAYSSYATVIGNYTSGGKGNILSISDSGYLQAYSSVKATWVTGTRKVPLNKPTIVGYICDADGITFYADTIHGEKFVGAFVPDTTDNNPASLGERGYGEYFFDGDIHHAFMIHRKLTQLEIKKLFNSVNNKISKEMKDVVIPIDAISLGCVKSNVSKLIDISTLPKYGVYKEPFLRGNKFFTGFIFLGTNKIVEIENPFGTTKVMATVFRKQNPWSEEMIKDEMFTYFYGNGNQARGFLWDKCTNDVLTFWTGSTCVANAGNEWNSDNSIGWFGFLIEKLDNSITNENDMMFQIDV